MEGGRLAATEVDGLMLGDQWGLTTTSIQTTLISQKCYPRLNHAKIYDLLKDLIRLCLFNEGYRVDHMVKDILVHNYSLG